MGRVGLLTQGQALLLCAPFLELHTMPIKKRYRFTTLKSHSGCY